MDGGRDAGTASAVSLLWSSLRWDVSFVLGDKTGDRRAGGEQRGREREPTPMSAQMMEREKSRQQAREYERAENRGAGGGWGSTRFGSFSPRY